MPDGPTARHDLAWEIDVPLLRAGMVGELARVFGLTAILMAALLSVLFVATGEPGAIPAAAAMCVVVAAMLFGVGVLAMAVVFRGRMRFRYAITERGVRLETVDPTVRAVNRATIVVGVLAGRPGAVGTGLIARSQEAAEVEWSGAFRASFDEGRRTITFRNAWRRLLVVYATPEAWPAAAARVRAELAAHGTESRAAGRRSPLPRTLAVTALAVVAALATFPLADAFDVSELLLTVVLCFAIATTWLISLFGWVVIGGSILVVAQVVASVLEVRPSFLRPGTAYRHLDVLSGDDMAVLVIGMVGLALLVALAVAALRGRLPSMLERDASDAGA